MYEKRRSGSDGVRVLERPGAPKALLLKAQEVGEVLGVNKSTVWSWESSGRIPRPVRIGGCTRWRRSEIEQWVAAGTPGREKWEGIQND